jgi:hypothetical protein
MKNPVEMALEDKFTFGKYKGVPLDNIIGFDREYITWCIDEQIILLDNKAYSEYSKGE